MSAHLSFEEVKSANKNQPFDLVEKAKSDKIDLQDLILMPNQFAYTIDCQKAELERVVGNTQKLGLINQDFKSIDVFYELIHSNDESLYLDTTLNNFKFFLGDEERCLPMRNLFSMSYRVKVNTGYEWVRRDTFASESYKGIVTKTIGIISVVPFVGAGHRQPQCFGPDSLYYGHESLSVFNPILTQRELELLKLIAEGDTTSMMAEKLCISKLTVETHRKNMIRKLKAKNTPHMVYMAKDIGLI